MAWTTPITWASGLVTSAMMNAQVRDNLNALQAMVKPGTAIVGTSPASTTLMTVQAFSAVVTVTAAAGTVNYPTSFANGIQSVLICGGDGAIIVSMNLTGASLGGMAFTAYSVGGAAFTGNLRVNVIAVGW